MEKAKKTVTHISKHKASQYLVLFNIRYYLKISLIYSKFLKQRKSLAKNLKIKFQQKRVKLKCSIDERTILLQFFATFSSKILLLECIFTYLQ